MSNPAPKTPYLNEEENLQNLVDLMYAPDVPQYQKFSNNRVDSCTVGRIYVIYEHDEYRPQVLGQIKVIDWNSNARKGSTMRIEDMATGQLQDVTHTPARVFDYDIFMYLPPFARQRFEARQLGDKLQRTMQFSVGIKTASRSSNFEQGAIYCESFKNIQKLYPDYKLNLSYI